MAGEKRRKWQLHSLTQVSQVSFELRLDFANSRFDPTTSGFLPWFIGSNKSETSARFVEKLIDHGSKHMKKVMLPLDIQCQWLEKALYQVNNLFNFL